MVCIWVGILNLETSTVSPRNRKFQTKAPKNVVKGSTLIVSKSGTLPKKKKFFLKENIVQQHKWPTLRHQKIYATTTDSRNLITATSVTLKLLIGFYAVPTCGMQLYTTTTTTRQMHMCTSACVAPFKSYQRWLQHWRAYTLWCCTLYVWLQFFI